MSARTRSSTAVALALTATLTAGTAALLTACGPTDPTAATTTRPAGGAAPASTGPAAGHKTGAAAPAALNGTAHNGLTISDGSRYVVMNGTTVDFGTAVHDLAWSPDGRKAAFIDGAGDLAVARADGGGRVVVARDPGGQTWSRPTWQVAPGDAQVPALDNLIFAVRAAGVSRLEVVRADAVGATPKTLSLGGEPGTPLPPKTGNQWPSAGGTHGTSVYAHPADGEVYIRDDYLRQQGGLLTPGSEPAMSTGENQEIVFVRSVGGHDHLFGLRGNGLPGSEKDLTPGATTDYTEPAISPDGKTVAARTSAGVVTLPFDGGHAPVLVSTHHGLPAYRD